MGMIEAVPKVERFMKGNLKSSRKVQWLIAVLFFLFNLCVWGVYLYQLHSLLDHH